MIGYRFLSPAEKELSEAALFYDAACAGLGNDFLDDVQQAIDKLRQYPELAEVLGAGQVATSLSVQRHLCC